MSHTAGCIYRRGSVYWVKIELDPDPLTGERRYHYKGGFTTKKEADAYRVQALSELQHGSFTAPAKLTLREYAARWLEAVKSNLEFNSWQAYEMNLRVRILPYLGNVELSKLQPLALQELYARLLKQGLSPRSVLYVHRTLHRMLEMAVKWGMVGRNVADAVEPPKQERKEMRVLDEDQAGVLLDGISDLRLKAAVALALGCGLRRSEICGLRWEDVDLGTGRLYLTQTVKRVKGEGLKARPTKTHRSRRPVDMPSGVVAVLKAWRRQQAAEKLAAGPLWEESGL
ncbi:MAG TPA: site-specific integrase, partial [Firmicutes bacterium]|nr:site-specific integrase [Bacillota bacterium]